MRREGEAQMPTNSSKNSRSSGGRREKVTEKSSSFNGRTATVMGGRELRRLSTLPNLWSDEQGARPLPSKLLLNVVVQGSVGALHVVTTSDSSVGDLICLALRQYGKEGRRPILPSGDPSRFDLHYSQFSLDSKLLSSPSSFLFACSHDFVKFDF
uniref:DUF7054 domain-containing protein n=1 Tax=Kalanchoe fedtschenkoi TaxID=63787 RepID=A0A7N0VEU4_KALFE